MIHNYSEYFMILGNSLIRIIFLGKGIVNTLNKTANENNLDLAILKNAVGHTILDVDSLEDEIGKLRAYQKY